jgi:RNA polymerase sigma factor (sigma-70 family)
MKDKRKDKRFGNHFVDHYPCSLSYARKKRGRIRYLNWATELCGCWDPEIEEKVLQGFSSRRERSDAHETINCEVRKAVEKLSCEDKQFIRLFYFEFKTYQQIAGKLGRKIHKLERIHQRALDKLRILLAGFVQERFNLEVPKSSSCIICNSPFRRELEQLIRDKRQDETYSRLIRIFKRKYGITVKTPQVIIGHRRKHMI